MDNNRTAQFLDIFRLGMMTQQQIQQKETLGVRSSYLGLSDLATYQECPRVALANKLSKASENLSRLITFGRGHWFEQGVADSFAAIGLNYMRQLEISHCFHEARIKGHLDMTLVWDKPHPAVRVLEIKSMEKLPDDPYQSHQWQITAQAALLKHYWNSPAFSFVSSEKMSFTDLCRQNLKMLLPENPAECSIEGWLLCISMTGAKVFGPFVSDQAFLKDLNIKCLTMWRQREQIKNGKFNLNDIPHANGFYPLCNWCPVNSDCPKFGLEIIQKDLGPVLSSLDRLKEHRSALDAEIRELEDSVKLACLNSGTDGWLNTVNHRVRVSSAKGRRMLDRNLLEIELADLFHNWKIESDSVESFLSRCEKEGKPASRLTIQPINQENENGI